MSARIDITVYGSRNAANRAMNLELKAGTTSLEAFRKDFEKLFREGIPGLWFHTLGWTSNATWRTLSAKMEEALGRLAPHAESRERNRLLAPQDRGTESALRHWMT